ncbi:hypothetical protein THIOM_001523 [Candidatus Thiomargarita nelsonii]|uniref:DUF3782 domain-containing protein n=1 Tax=Candidatus Thiomargarita nelsonii TaxID=1003181 RepID=A0A176S3I0_9GAMM|nr:hypothetical protein THIOM_001523 [Candidatus Thiomargarita nelsonii]
MKVAKKDLSHIREEVLTILPQLLREEPEVITAIEGIIARQFPRRDEFASLLKEIKLQREETSRQIKLQREETSRQIKLQREETSRQLEQTNRRIDLLGEEMNRRLEQMEQRIEQVEQRVDLLREEMNQRFDQVDQRFDQVHQDHLELKRRVIKLESGQKQILEKMTGFDAWLKVITGNLGTEKGQTLEDLFAIALRYGLKNPNIKPESIRLRQELMDVEGLVFRKNYGTEIDLIAENGKLTVFEVKATANIDDVDLFGMKIELVRLQNQDKEVQGILVSPGAGERIKKRCMEFRLELLD